VADTDRRALKGLGVIPGKQYSVDDVIEIIKRRVWLIVVPFVLMASGAVVQSKLTPNLYRSETVILVVPQQIPESYVRATVTSRALPRPITGKVARIGNMEPSKSSLDRLPKTLGDRWEAEREKYEQVLREAIVVPEGAHTIAVSIDGVLAPIDGGASPTKVRADAASEGRTSKGPAGYREMGCATLAFCDAEGDLISAIRFGRGPESKKLALKETLRKDLVHVLSQAPHLRLAKITDAGGDNWEYTATLPDGPEILDFFHATIRPKIGSPHIYRLLVTMQCVGSGARKAARRFTHRKIYPRSDCLRIAPRLDAAEVWSASAYPARAFTQPWNFPTRLCGAG